MVANVCIVAVLLGLGIAVFTVDMSAVFLSVSAPIYQGNAGRKNVSLMINVYWGTEFIKPMMQVLESEGAQATFFLGGSWVQGNMALTRDIANAFEVGSHAYTHKDMKTMSELNQRKELQNTHELVKSVTGVDMKLFAPPSGSFGKTTLKVAESMGYSTIMWSKDTIDWRDKDRDLVFNRATRNLKNGDLVLMHPTEHTLAALPDIIKFYKEQGFSVVSVTRNIEN